MATIRGGTKGTAGPRGGAGGTRISDPRYDLPEPVAPDRGGAVSSVEIPLRYPDWREPPLPSSPVPTTPAGSSTKQGRQGGTYSNLVATGWRFPILYGQRRITPDLVYAVSRPYSGYYLGDYVGVISDGEIDSVVTWHTCAPGASNVHEVWLGGLTTRTSSDSAFTPYVRATLGCAAFAIQTDGVTSQVPSCTAKGRKLFDPRLGAWGTGEYPASAYCAYSNNPALVMADLLTHPQYGIGVAPANVDWTSVEDAADWCDELVSGEKRFTFDLWLQAGATAEEWLETVGLHAGLRWREVGGVHTLDFVAGTESVNATITEDHLVEGSRPTVKFGSGAGLADLPNRFTAEYAEDPTDLGGLLTGNGIKTTTIQTAAVDAGEAPRESSTYKLHGFKTETMAKRALSRIGNEIWSEVEVDLALTVDMLHLEPGARVTLQLPSLGLVGVDFRVTRKAYDAGTVRITASLYNALVWDEPTAGSLDGPSPVGASDPTVGTLPSPPPPTPSAAPTAPAVLSFPPDLLVPLYRRLDESPEPANGEVATWDAATRTVRFEVGGGGGGGSPLAVKEADGSPSVASVAELQFAGATVEEVSAGVAKVTVTGGGSGATPVLTRDVFTATAGQTTFALSGTPATDDFVLVTRDGIPARGADWSLVGATVVFGTGLDAGVEVEIAYWTSVPSGSVPHRDAFVATDGQTDFALSYAPNLVLVVAVAGVSLLPTGWLVVDGTTLRLSTGAFAGDDVWVAYLTTVEMPLAAFGPQGPEGPQGATGPQGPQGDPGPSLTVEEADGTPSVVNVGTLKFANSVVTDEGAGVVTVTPAGGGGDFLVMQVFS